MRGLAAAAALLVPGPARADLPDLATVPPDLEVPALSQGAPGPGRRVLEAAPGWETTAVRHALYLPPDWRAAARLPLLVEYPGNGGYSNRFGDVCEGMPEKCSLGYGLSAGKGFLWLCLPFVERGDAGLRVARNWWGDIAETKRYCQAAVADTVARHGGDASRVVLCGFSRGAIACNFIGLHDARTAALWSAFFCHSHYDGVRTNWPYPGADRASALERLRRLGGRPQWISQEASTADTEAYLRSTAVEAPFAFHPIPFRNHSDRWVLRDIPERRAAREWLARVTSGSNLTSRTQAR